MFGIIVALIHPTVWSQEPGRLRGDLEDNVESVTIFRKLLDDGIILEVERRASPAALAETVKTFSSMNTMLREANKSGEWAIPIAAFEHRFIAIDGRVPSIQTIAETVETRFEGQRPSWKCRILDATVFNNQLIVLSREAGATYITVHDISREIGQVKSIDRKLLLRDSDSLPRSITHGEIRRLPDDHHAIILYNTAIQPIQMLTTKMQDVLDAKSEYPIESQRLNEDNGP